MTLEKYIAAASEGLDTAHSLPFEVYKSQSVFEAETQALFACDWVFACMEQELAKPGEYFAFSVAQEPVFVMRGDGGELRGMSNICRHRGTPLLDAGFGQVDKYIVCPYHAWSYAKDGALKAVPFSKLIAVHRDEHQLPPFQLAVWNGLVFINLDVNAEPLERRLEGLDAYLTLFEPHTFTEIERGDTECWHTNWKLAMENAMESYHLFKVHETTLEQYTPSKGAYYIAGNSEWTLTGGRENRKPGLLEKLWTSGSAEALSHYILISMPPSFIGVLSYGSLAWLSIIPESESSTRVRSGAISLKGYQSGRAESAFTQAFFAEDKAICERVQSGMSAKLGKGGKLVDMERVLVDFHQYWASRLSASNSKNPGDTTAVKTTTRFVNDEAAGLFLD